MTSCTACGVNPFDYLVDVLHRVGTHPASHIGELPPDRWQPVAQAAWSTGLSRARPTWASSLGRILFK